jgi:transglutaminase-like putative cysteine protease
MKNSNWFLLLLLIVTGCGNEKPLINNPDRLMDIAKMVKVQKELTANSLKPIWPVLDNPASKNEGQALNFLFAYMPLSDLADYSPEFMLANVKKSLLARKEMDWGNKIPEEEYLHFVLPLRVNNENLDSFRLEYYDEIKARVRGLKMKEAALEINHWCHEKVNYRGTDSRTSAPMSTIKKTFGRCGEESTFTVASMRTAGIPSRQVYTPRWAHTDDNHAWVEVWIDGSWHYMGACEPDADLDMGWFSEPSQRTMMVHTRTYGRYFGPEEVMDAEDRFSELNLTANYAKTKRVTILVSNSDGTPVKGANVEFKLYNYAEFYPIATITTDDEGAARLTTGMGDLLVWASKEGKFAYKNLSVANTDTVRLELNQSGIESHAEIYDLVPPKAFKSIKSASDQARKINDQRLAHEDSIRNVYLGTFKDSLWIQSYAIANKISEDTLMRVLRLSYGNWKEITTYLENNLENARKLLLPLTCGISAKDLSDTKASILSDHLRQTIATSKSEDLASGYFEKYVLAPRVDLEILSPWRSFIWKNMGVEIASSTRKDIMVLIGWINANIRIDAVANKHSKAPLTPIGVYNLRAADPLSRDIFFVAACRTFGIPARLNPETHIAEYWKEGIWHRANFEEHSAPSVTGNLILKDLNNSITPQYTLHFTIAKISDGKCQTLEFEEGRKLTEFPNPMQLETGKYLLVTGRRLADASVLSSLTIFEISEEKPTTIEVTLRSEECILESAGKLDPTKMHLNDQIRNRDVTLADLLQSENSVVVLMDPGSEPSKHILNDLTPYIDIFNAWKGQFIFVSIDDKREKSATFQNYKLPNKSNFACDIANDLGNALTTITGKDSKNNLPMLFFCKSSGEIMMISVGYKIGTGEQLVQLIKTVKYP